MRDRLLVLTALTLVCTCCSASPSSPALKACDAWTSAGIGNTAVTTSRRKASMDRAVRLADQAARADSRWGPLDQGLRREKGALESQNYSVEATSTYFQEIEPSCQAAGQPP